MANVAITGLPVVGTMANTSVLPVVVSGTTSQISGENLRTFIGSGNAAGANTQVQFNDGNVFAGNTGFTFNKSTGVLAVTGNITGNYFIGNGSQLTEINAETVDVTNTNGLTTTYYPTFVENRTTEQIVRADVDLSYRTDTNTLTVGNITAGNTSANSTSATNLYANVDTVIGNRANVSATKTRITSDGQFSYIQTGNGTIGSTGNIVFSPYSDPAQRVVVDTSTGNVTAAGNVTAQNFIGNISITGNVIGTSANVDLVAGSYEWSFDNTGNLTLPGNTFAVNYANNTQIDIVTKFEGSWTAPVGNSTQSFTVDANETYQMWVSCNIPNGIIAWNAIATITNTNVPVVGTQYAWVYDAAGTPIDFTSIPNQFVGTSNTIVRSNASPGITTNRFDFGINNSSGSPQTVRYGWIRIS